MTINVKAIVIRADVPSINGNVYPAEVLKTMHDGKNFFWDDDKKELSYVGLLPGPQYMQHIHDHPIPGISVKMEGQEQLA
jgi:hypothetical protein